MQITEGLNHDYAYWLADKLPALGEKAECAARFIRRQSNEIERLRQALASMGVSQQHNAADGIQGNLF